MADSNDPSCQFSVTVTESLRDRIDSECRERGCSRADFVREAVLELLRRQAIRRSRAS